MLYFIIFSKIVGGFPTYECKTYSKQRKTIYLNQLQFLIQKYLHMKLLNPIIFERKSCHTHKKIIYNEIFTFKYLFNLSINLFTSIQFFFSFQLYKFVKQASLYSVDFFFLINEHFTLHKNTTKILRGIIFKLLLIYYIIVIEEFTYFHFPIILKLLTSLYKHSFSCLFYVRSQFK